MISSVKVACEASSSNKKADGENFRSMLIFRGCIAVATCWFNQGRMNDEPAGHQSGYHPKGGQKDMPFLNVGSSPMVESMIFFDSLNL